jgi:UDP-N-acetylmuramyl pentapeptide synthase
VRAAIDVLAALPKPQTLILGDMGEVGEQGPAFHAEVGAYAATRGIQRFWGCGALAQHAVAAFVQQGGGQSRAFAQPTDAVAALQPGDLQRGSLLIKGSRFMRMERVVQAVEALDRNALNSQKGGSHAA